VGHPVIGLFAVTAAGRRAAAELAAALGPDAVLVDGPIGPALQRTWPELDAAVCFLASGATVRLIAPLLVDKATDPGVVCVDEGRRFAIALAGGHGGGANDLAERVADVLGCTPVVTTASDATGSTPLDELVALLDATVDGDLAACGVAILDGAPVRLTGLHGLTFIRPVRRHVFVHVRSAVAHTDGNSLTVLVNVDAEQPLAGEHEETVRAFLTYAPADARTGIPPLECIGDDERAAFAEVEQRLALQRSLPQPEADSIAAQRA